MSDFDDVVESGRRQLERLNAQMAAANAEYQRARIEGDIEGQDPALQNWSELENQAVNLHNSYNRQIAAQQAAAPRELSAEEKAAPARGELRCRAVRPLAASYSRARPHMQIRAERIRQHQHRAGLRPFYFDMNDAAVVGFDLRHSVLPMLVQAPS